MNRLIKDNNEDEFTTCIKSIIPVNDIVIRELSPEFTFSEVAWGDHFVHQGMCNSDIAFIYTGLFRAYFVTEEGKEFIKYFLSDSDVMASGMEPGNESRVSIQALEDSTLFTIDHGRFQSLCFNFPELEELKKRVISRYWSKKEIREMNMLSNDAKRNYEIFLEEYSTIADRIPQYHIAGYLGITPTQLSRLKKQR